MWRSEILENKRLLEEQEKEKQKIKEQELELNPKKREALFEKGNKLYPDFFHTSIKDAYEKLQKAQLIRKCISNLFVNKYKQLNPP
ncbi:MAG: hypothetical protein QXV83_04345 [Candidatus Anstonellaceae archaeon]